MITMTSVEISKITGIAHSQIVSDIIDTLVLKRNTYNKKWVNFYRRLDEGYLGISVYELERVAILELMLNYPSDIRKVLIEHLHTLEGSNLIVNSCKSIQSDLTELKITANFGSVMSNYKRLLELNAPEEYKRELLLSLFNSKIVDWILNDEFKS